MLNKKQAQKDLHENGNKHEVRKKIVLIKKLPHKNTSKDRTANGTVALTACRMWRRWEPTGLGYLQDTGLVTRVLTRQVAFRGDRHILSSRITSHSFPWKEHQMYPTSNNYFPPCCGQAGDHVSWRITEFAFSLPSLE